MGGGGGGRGMRMVLANYNEICGEASPERGTFIRKELEVCKRVGISRVEV